MTSRTVVSIQGEDFQINGQPTYAGRAYRGRRIEGLLLNSRMVQGIFDDVSEVDDVNALDDAGATLDGVRGAEDGVEGVGVGRVLFETQQVVFQAGE